MMLPELDRGNLYTTHSTPALDRYQSHVGIAVYISL